MVRQHCSLGARVAWTLAAPLRLSSVRCFQEGSSILFSSVTDSPSDPLISFPTPPCLPPLRSDRTSSKSLQAMSSMRRSSSSHTSTMWYVMCYLAWLCWLRTAVHSCACMLMWLHACGGWFINSRGFVALGSHVHLACSTISCGSNCRSRRKAAF